MAATGPFRIDGEDWETDTGGTITRTRPAVPADVRTPQKSRAERVRERKIADRDRLIEEITERTTERDRLISDIANLDTIIANSR